MPDYPSYDGALAALLEISDQRVWSLIVTLFGDMAQDHGAKISGATLSKITEKLCIRPEATRVALHRLRKDGWLASRKSGRNSEYYLTNSGRLETLRASALIYAKNIDQPTDWHVQIIGSKPLGQRKALTRALLKQGYVALNTTVFLGQGAQQNINGCMSLQSSGFDLPEWASETIFSNAQQAGFHQMENVLTRVRNNIPAGMRALETVALRVMIVHIWRKPLLRTPVLPLDLLPENSRLPACRDLVHDLLTVLERPLISDI